MWHVFIVGSKGIPGAYGGYETFVDKLTEYHQDNEQIKYHVACKNSEKKEFKYHNARCFNIRVPNIGPAQAIYYDVAALMACCKYIRKYRIEHPIIYILACRIGCFAPYYQRRIHKLGGEVYVNPDGHEWMRAKWSALVRKYWKFSERVMVKHADLLICDSRNIERYIHDTYDKKGMEDSSPKTAFIAYGAETRRSCLEDDSSFMDWLAEKELKKKEYYLIVGRFVPENNYEIMIREFMKSKSKKALVVITTVNEKFLSDLETRLHFRQDKRIRFMEPVYNQGLLKKIRENAYGYLHGHEVGGTNPSLLEALGSTDLNLLLDVGFNREVAEDAALYWTKAPGSLKRLIEETDQMDEARLQRLGRSAKQRIADGYTWEMIAGKYERLFTGAAP